MVVTEHLFYVKGAQEICKGFLIFQNVSR